MATPGCGIRSCPNQGERPYVESLSNLTLPIALEDKGQTEGGGAFPARNDD
jgi:hypothetical protein